MGARFLRKKPRPHADERITIDERWKVSFWMTALQCSEAELRDALDAAGNLRIDVEAYLNAES